MDSHVSYCSAADLDIGAGDSQTYIKEKQLIYMEGKSKADGILDWEENSNL